MGFFKNPLSHKEVGIDEARLAASRIILANELASLAITQSRMVRDDPCDHLIRESS